jgi:hypothetical protein
MATRNRVIYQSQAVYVSQDVNSTGILTGNNDNIDLDRIQSCNYSFSISRQDVNQFGELASIDRIITETPTVSLEGSYLMANMGNEKKLGFNIFAGPNDAANTTPVSCISGILNTETNDTVKNYYILTTKEGSDAADNTNSGNYESIVGIGNASITSYSTEGAVGGLPSTSFSVEGQNLNVVETPYTGAFLNYTGLNGPGSTASAVYEPKRIDGYGYDTVVGNDALKVQVTGAVASVPAGNNLTLQITTGDSTADVRYNNVAGAQATIPAGKVLLCAAPTAGTTFTLRKNLEKGAQQMVGDLNKAIDIGTQYSSIFTGAFDDVISYISGSNPSINATDGTEQVWNAHSGNASAAGTLLKQEAGWPLNPAPIKLPVPLTSLNTSDVNPSGSISTLRPGDITLTLTKSDGTAEDIAGASFSDAHIQSYTISFDLGRTPIQRIGSRFAFSRPVDFPVTASFSFDAVLSDLTTGSIADLIDCDDNYEAVVQLKHAPDCNAANVKETVAAYVLKKIKLESQSFSTSIGDNKTVTMDFSCQIGGPEQSDVGVFMSGYSTELNDHN